MVGARKKGALKYTRARELLREVMAKVGLDVELYGLHSLRSGGATAAAAEGVPQRLIKRHGGWRSDAVNAYLEETVENVLAASKAVQLE